MTPSRTCARGHTVAGRDRNYRGDCLVCKRLLAHGVVKPASGPHSEPWNPYYADLPCPSCHSRYTVPFDPRPERAGRGPSSGLGTCVQCGHVFSPLALPASGVGPPAPEASSGSRRESRSQSDANPGGLATAAVAPNGEGAA